MSVRERAYRNREATLRTQRDFYQDALEELLYALYNESRKPQSEETEEFADDTLRSIERYTNKKLKISGFGSLRIEYDLPELEPVPDEPHLEREINETILENPIAQNVLNRYLRDNYLRLAFEELSVEEQNEVLREMVVWMRRRIEDLVEHIRRKAASEPAIIDMSPLDV
jgi:hypothetical protein